MGHPLYTEVAPTDIRFFGLPILTLFIHVRVEVPAGEHLIRKHAQGRDRACKPTHCNRTC